MSPRCLTAVLVLAATLVPAAAQQPQPLPRPGQSGAPPAPPMQQLGRPPGQPATPQPQQLGRQPPAQPGPQAQPAPGGQQQQPAPAIAPPRPYKPVMVTLAQPFNDPGLAALRQQIAAAAQRKDRAALARLIVAQGFFWFKAQGDGVDKRKSSLDNLATALDLGAQDGSGWETLAAFATDKTAEPLPDRQGVVCAPAGPQFNEQELEQLTKTSQTDIGEWAYTVTNGADVRAQPQPNAPVIEKLGLQFVRVMLDETPQTPNTQTVSLVRVVTPSGRVGYVSEEDLAPPDLDQVCYIKDATGAWKIGGLISAGED